jgi:hypothetical protein
VEWFEFTLALAIGLILAVPMIVVLAPGLVLVALAGIHPRASRTSS